MRSYGAVLIIFTLLAGCGSSELPSPSAAASAASGVPAQASPAASVQASPAASAQASPSASGEAASPVAQAPQPTLVPTDAPSQQPSPASATAAPSAQPSTAPVPPLVRTLQLTEPPAEGDDVRILQQRLTELGYTQVGAADGIFGTLTDTAVRAFQQVNGLDVDGIVGPRTWEQLFGDAVPASALVPVVSLPTGWLLGGTVEGRWIDFEATAPFLTGNEPYRVPGSQTAYSGGVPSTPEVPCETAYAVQLSPQPPGDFSVAVGGDFELHPRPVSEEDPTQEAYRSQVAAFLTAQGIAEPDVQIQQALGVDLDGDGSRELVLGATRLGDAQDGLPVPVTPRVEAGDYSVVMVLREGQTAPVILDSNVFPAAEEFSAPQRFLVVGIYDLNGDGRMEIVVDGAYYEGVYINAYDVQGNAAASVLGNGCGV